MNDKTRDSLAIVGCFTTMLILVATVIFATIANGWAASILWDWFAVPFGLPEISIPQAIGLTVLITALFPEGYVKDTSGKETKELVSLLITHTIIKPLMRVAIGWVVLQFMLQFIS